MAYWRGSSTALSNGGTWISQVGMRERHDTLAGSVFADKAGELFVEQSSDGTNWDVSEKLSVEASKGKLVNVTLLLPYWRVRYVNGGESQGSFRISVNTQAGGDS
jgi:hypothetical protein